MQTFGVPKGLPSSTYRKGIDARQRMEATLEPILAQAVRDYTAGDAQGSPQSNPGVIAALLKALQAGQLPLETQEGATVAVALANDAMFLMFAGAWHLALLCALKCAEHLE
jgi:hypothetical protein